MPLQPGARLGPYEIVAAIGAGGMGEVFRARDTKLNRDVAIKVLPAAFADDPERLARFTREAQTLASLNHPNIATIYGQENVGAPLVGALDPTPDARERAGTRPAPTGPTIALIMELVEGEDLSVHIARGPIPIAEALPIARQIAEALEGAHERGIVHRDLKPANIKVRTDGTVKVLDFGLAKAMDGGGATNSAMSQSPTMSRHMTEMGMIIGTTVFLSTPALEFNPMFSPDGRWIAYASDEAGAQHDFYVRPFPGPGGKWRISTESGRFPIWSGAAHELLFVSQGKVMFAPYAVVGDSFRAERPQIWSPAGFRVSGNDYPYDLHPDGKRLALFAAADQTSVVQDKVVFFFNFGEYLKKIAPVTKP